jgi:hypothetical protein
MAQAGSLLMLAEPEIKMTGCKRRNSFDGGAGKIL